MVAGPVSKYPVKKVEAIVILAKARIHLAEA